MLIELVMGMLIAGVVLLAAATFSFAMRQGQETTNLMLDNQAMVRGAAVQLIEQVRQAKHLEQTDLTTVYLDEMKTSFLTIEAIEDSSTLKLNQHPLLQNCRDLTMELDEPKRFLVVRFQLREETGWRDYAICAAGRCGQGG
jgi:Tfp pilus assembly protein PilW